MASRTSDIKEDAATRFDSSPESTEKTPNDAPPAPPDGGFDAWLRVFAAFLIFINTW
jgi:hypothetical protein